MTEWETFQNRRRHVIGKLHPGRGPLVHVKAIDNLQWRRRRQENGWRGRDDSSCRGRAEHTVDVIFNHPRWPIYWVIVGRRRSSICEFCPVVPTKETTDVGSSTPGFAVHCWSSTRSGKHQLRRSDNSTATSSADVPRWARQYRELHNHGNFLAPPTFSFFT